MFQRNSKQNKQKKYNRKLNKKFGSQNRKQVGLVLAILMKVYDK